jgi:hypothetical protein
VRKEFCFDETGVFTSREWGMRGWTDLESKSKNVTTQKDRREEGLLQMYNSPPTYSELSCWIVA